MGHYSVHNKDQNIGTQNHRDESGSHVDQKKKGMKVGTVWFYISEVQEKKK